MIILSFIDLVHIRDPEKRWPSADEMILAAGLLAQGIENFRVAEIVIARRAFHPLPEQGA